MSLHLFFSNDIERLADELWTQMKAAWTEPLRPPPLLVPNRAIDTWLKLRFSRAEGVVMGLEATFIETFLWDLLVCGPHPHPPVPALIHGGLLAQWLLHCMKPGGDIDKDDDLAPLREYCAAAGEEAAAQRRIGMAGRLAGLFLEYEYNRPDLFDSSGHKSFDGILSAWPNRAYFSTRVTGAEEMEGWQRRLYGLVFGDGGIAARVSEATGRRYTTLPRALAGMTPKDIAARAAGNGLEQPVFVFGMSGLSLFHRQTLLGLSLGHDVHVFTLNPCSVFWEDAVTTRREMGVRAGKRRRCDMTELSRLTLSREKWEKFEADVWDERSLGQAEDDNELLVKWGHAGRENIALWCQAAEYNFDELFVEPSASTLLASLQRCLLYRAAEAPQRTGGDDSLMVISAPGVRREVEIIRDSILDAMRRDTSLTPEDIGVYVADMSTYRAALHEVFDACREDDPLHIPWRLCDATAGTTLFSEAVSALIDLADGDFSRNAVFAFLRNPLVAAACGVDAAALDAWEEWARSLNVSHGIDAEHRRRMGEHEPWRQHTWLRAFERLMAGHICDADIVLKRHGESPDDVVRPCTDIESGADELCCAFIRTVEALGRDTATLGRARSWTEAVRRLEETIACWICVGSEQEAEQAAREQYIDGIRMMAIRDHIDSAPPERREFLRLARLSADVELPLRSSFFSGKLTVGAIRQSRAIPFRIICVLGLNEGVFPGSPIRDTLDLRAWKYMPGDQRPQWQNQYAFLELITCAKERLVLSFKGRDEAGGEKLLPSSTLCELISFVNKACMRPGTVFGPVDVPLLAEGEREMRTTASDPRLPPSYVEEAAQMRAPADVPAPERRGAAPAGACAREIAAYVSVSRLKSFLKNPLEHTLRYGLGLGDYDVDIIERDDAEPFATTDELLKWRLKSAFIDRACGLLFGEGRRAIRGDAMPEAGDDSRWREVFRDVYEEFLVNGKTPESVFAHIDCAALTESAVRMGAIMQTLPSMFDGWEYDDDVVLTSRDSRDTVRRWIEVNMGGGRRIRLSSGPYRTLRKKNSMKILALTASGGVLEQKKSEAAHLNRFSKLLDHMLFAVAMTAGGAATPSVYIVSKEGVCDYPLHCTAKQAHDYLCGLIAAMEDPARRFDHLPVEAVEALWVENGRIFDEAAFSAEAIESWLEDQEEKSHHKQYTIRLEALRIARRTVPADSASIIARRFGLFLAGGNA